MRRKSVYDFPRKHLALVFFGACNPGAMRRLQRLLCGEQKMTVDQLYTLFKVEPLLDLELSLRDLYDRYEIAKAKKRRGKKPKEFRFLDELGARARTSEPEANGGTGGGVGE